jgi:hypothetical protein
MGGRGDKWCWARWREFTTKARRLEEGWMNKKGNDRCTEERGGARRTPWGDEFQFSMD